MSTVGGPNRFSNSWKTSRLNIESSGMSSLESSSAIVFSSLGTHFTLRVIRCSSPNQKSSRVKACSFSRGLHRFTTHNRFCASTCNTPNFPSTKPIIACKHLRTPRSSMYVDDSTVSSFEKYLCARSAAPCVAYPPHTISLASDAVRMDTPSVGGHMKPSNLRCGKNC